MALLTTASKRATSVTSALTLDCHQASESERVAVMVQWIGTRYGELKAAYVYAASIDNKARYCAARGRRIFFSLE